MPLSEIIIDNYILLFLLLLPVIYFIARDIIGIFYHKKSSKLQKQRIIESEQKIFKLLQESDTQKAELIKNLIDLRKKVANDIDKVNQKLDDEQKK